MTSAPPPPEAWLNWGFHDLFSCVRQYHFLPSGASTPCPTMTLWVLLIPAAPPFCCPAGVACDLAAAPGERLRHSVWPRETLSRRLFFDAGNITESGPTRKPSSTSSRAPLLDPPART